MKLDGNSNLSNPQGKQKFCMRNQEFEKLGDTVFNSSVRICCLIILMFEQSRAEIGIPLYMCLRSIRVSCTPRKFIQQPRWRGQYWSSTYIIRILLLGWKLHHCQCLTHSNNILLFKKWGFQFMFSFLTVVISLIYIVVSVSCTDPVLFAVGSHLAPWYSNGFSSFNQQIQIPYDMDVQCRLFFLIV